MTSQENENREEFDALLEDLKDNVISLELKDFEGDCFKHNSLGTTSEEYNTIQTLYNSETPVQIQKITYDEVKYMLLKCICQIDKKNFYYFLAWVKININF